MWWRQAWTTEGISAFNQTLRVVCDGSRLKFESRQAVVRAKGKEDMHGISRRPPVSRFLILGAVERNNGRRARATAHHPRFPCCCHGSRHMNASRVASCMHAQRLLGELVTGSVGLQEPDAGTMAIGAACASLCASVAMMWQASMNYCSSPWSSAALRTGHQLMLDGRAHQ